METLIHSPRVGSDVDHASRVAVRHAPRAPSRSGQSAITTMTSVADIERCGVPWGRGCGSIRTRAPSSSPSRAEPKLEASSSWGLRTSSHPMSAVSVIASEPVSDPSPTAMMHTIASAKSTQAAPAAMNPT